MDASRWAELFIRTSALIDDMPPPTRKLALALAVGLAFGLPDTSADKGAQARPAVAAPAVWKAGVKNGLASGLAVVCSKSLLQPFDTLKTLQQASSSSGGMVGAASKLVSAHGFLALYRGLGISLFGAVPSMSAYFAVYQSSKALLLSHATFAPPLLLVAVSAAFANTIASTLRVPCELVKQRLQAGVYPSLLAAVTSLNAGGAALWLPRDAWLAQVARDVPFGVAMFITYESLSRSRLGRGGEALADEQPTPAAIGRGGSVRPATVGRGNTGGALRSSMFGMVAGAIATLLTNPMDVLKTRVMTSTSAAGPGGMASYARSAADIWASEGMLGFSRGATARLLHKIPASGLFWLLYAAFSHALGVSDAPALRRKERK